MGNKIIIIGSGFSSLSAACYLAKKDFEQFIAELNNDGTNKESHTSPSVNEKKIAKRKQRNNSILVLGKV